MCHLLRISDPESAPRKGDRFQLGGDRRHESGYWNQCRRQHWPVPSYCLPPTSDCLLRCFERGNRILLKPPDPRLRLRHRSQGVQRPVGHRARPCGTRRGPTTATRPPRPPSLVVAPWPTWLAASCGLRCPLLMAWASCPGWAGFLPAPTRCAPNVHWGGSLRLLKTKGGSLRSRTCFVGRVKGRERVCWARQPAAAAAGSGPRGGSPRGPRRIAASTPMGFPIGLVCGLNLLWRPVEDPVWVAQALPQSDEPVLRVAGLVASPPE
jgi:hypothetical protein